jgi:Zn-finger nucleic acid-binding protein
MGERKCPECQEIMSTEHHHAIEINSCSTCKWVFLEFWKIKSLVDSTPVQEIFGDNLQWKNSWMNTPQDILCPDCKKSMDTREYIYGSHNFINFCKSCGWIYLNAEKISSIQRFESEKIKSDEARKLLAKIEMEWIMASKIRILSSTK